MPTFNAVKSRDHGEINNGIKAIVDAMAVGESIRFSNSRRNEIVLYTNRTVKRYMMQPDGPQGFYLQRAT